MSLSGKLEVPRVQAKRKSVMPAEAAIQEIDPTSGADAGKAIDSIFQLEAGLVAKMKSFLLGD